MGISVYIYDKNKDTYILYTHTHLSFIAARSSSFPKLITNRKRGEPASTMAADFERGDEPESAFPFFFPQEPIIPAPIPCLLCVYPGV